MNVYISDTEIRNTYDDDERITNNRAAASCWAKSVIQT